MADAMLSTHAICPILVGREAYLQSLQQFLTRTQAGQLQVALLAGEAGIGKTRLIAELKKFAVERGYTLWQGQCFEADRTLPFAPLLDLLRQLSGQPRTAETLRPVAPELLKLLPELSPLFPNLAPAPALEPEQENRRLFSALTSALAPLSRKGSGAGGEGQLFILEDLHWCDDTSLEFLLGYLRQMKDYPLGVALTYRADEVGPALRHFLAELDRTRLATEWVLKRLTASEVETMIRAIFGQTQPVRGEFVNLVHELTEGNPFFVEETLKALVASGEIYLAPGGWTRKPVSELHVPRTVQDAVERRTRLLSAPARQTLTLAAVAGRRFDFDLLRDVTQHTEAELIQQVKELVAAQLVAEESASRFAFRHALTREAILAHLLTRERQPLHGALAEAMERRYAHTLEPWLADLGYHFYEAGRWAQALAYARRAGERAQAVYAPRAAVEHFTRALNAAHNLPASTVPLELYRVRGQMWQTLGELDAAEQDFQAMLNQAEARADRTAEWQALMELGFLWAARDYARTGQYFRRALELARMLDDSATLAHNLNRIGNWHLNLAQPLEARRYHLEALRVFDSLNDIRGLAATLDLLGITALVASDAVAMVHNYERAMALFRELGDRGGLTSSLSIYASRGADYVGSLLVPVPTPLADRRRDSEMALKMAMEIGSRPAEAMYSMWLGLGLGAAGEYGRALENIQHGLQVAEAIEHRHFMTTGHMILGMAYLDLLALPLARAQFEQVLTLARETGSHVWMGIVTGLLAAARVRAQQLPQAEAVLAAQPVAEEAMQAVNERHWWAAHAELLLARHEAAEALNVIENLIATAPNITTAAHGIPRLSRLHGEALLALRHVPEAQAAFVQALAAAQAYQLRPEIWRAQAGLAKCYLVEGKRELAEDVLADARAHIEALVATLTDEGLAKTFRQEALYRLPTAPPLSAREAAKRAFGGLTPRERDVATLIAQGKSNKEIAEAMTLSPRTVEAHITNILGKLALTSRAQIVAWALEKGLGRKP